MIAEQITREVTRQLAPQAAGAEPRPSSPPTAPSGRPPRKRSSTRDIPSDPAMAGVVSPDDSGRAAGSVEFDPRTHVEPSVAPAYESPGPYPGLGLGEAADHRALGQPAPRGARWQPGAEDSGPKAAAPTWQPPLTEEPTRPEQASGSDAVWQAPAWLRPEERPAPAAAAPSWTPPSYEQPAPAPSPTPTPAWGAPASAAPSWTPPTSQLVDAPVWNPEPEPAAPRRRAQSRGPRIPELGLDPEPIARAERAATTGVPADDDEFVDGGFADEFEDDEFDDGEFDDEPAARAPAKADRRARKGDKQAAALEPEPTVTASSTPVTETTAPSKPSKPKASKPKSDDDDDFDDDDDDFDDDDDDFDDDDDLAAGSATSISAASVAATAQPRKLPWIPIAVVASALVLISSYVFRDALFGTGEGEGDEAGEVANTETEPPPEPEQPKPEPEKVEEPEPEPPPPAIAPEELDKMIADATNLVNRQKHNDANAIIDEILAKIPKEPRALSLRAMTLMEKQKYDDSLATANDCVEADPTQANCWIVIASVEQLKDNLPRALEGYRKYLEHAPDGRYAKSAKLEAQRLTAKVEG